MWKEAWVFANIVFVPQQLTKWNIYQQYESDIIKKTNVWLSDVGFRYPECLKDHTGLDGQTIIIASPGFAIVDIHVKRVHAKCS